MQKVVTLLPMLSVSVRKLTVLLRAQPLVLLLLLLLLLLLVLRQPRLRAPVFGR